MLETVFYALSIVTMTLLLGMLVAIIAITMRIKASIESFKEGFAGKVVGLLKERNVEVASALGLTFAHFVMDRMKQAFSEKKSKRD